MPSRIFNYLFIYYETAALIVRMCLSILLNKTLIMNCALENEKKNLEKILLTLGYWFLGAQAKRAPLIL